MTVVCIFDMFTKILSDSARHQLSQGICPPISLIVLKNFIKNSSIIKECPEEILIKLAIVLKISSLAETLNNIIVYFRVKHNKGQCSVAAELKIQVLLFLKATCFLWSIMSEVGMMLRLLRITC